MLRVVSFTSDPILEVEISNEILETLSTETLASFIKRRVSQRRRVSIFRQRLLCGEHIIADGEMWEELGRPCEIQIMFAHYVNDYADDLFTASMAGDEATARQVLRQLQDPNVLDSEQQSPLWKASAAGHAGLVQLLCQADADLESRDQHSKTPLTVAAEANHLEVARCLVDARADVAWACLRRR